MFIRRRSHEVPQLNTASTADISFMLLVFFLMTSSMNSDKGLSRQLPPATSTPSATTDINRSNVLQIRLDAEDRLWMADRPIAASALQREVESFVASRQSPRYMIEVTTDRCTSYNAYFDTQNTIVAAFRTLRDRMAQQRFGLRLAQCNNEQRETIIRRYPMRISEAVTDGGNLPETTAEKGGRP